MREKVRLGPALIRLVRAVARTVTRGVRASGPARAPSFASAGHGLILEPPYHVRNPDRIYLGDDVRIGPNSVLKAKTKHVTRWPDYPEQSSSEQGFAPILRIGNRVTATAMLRVTVYDRVTIEDDVMLAANVYIADGSHSMKRGDVAYRLQGIDRVAPVHIGRGAWIGQNAVVMPGVTIGPMAVVGANSVVTRDVGAGQVVAGAPARVIRSWDERNQCWRSGSPVTEASAIAFPKDRS